MINFARPAKSFGDPAEQKTTRRKNLQRVQTLVELTKEDVEKSIPERFEKIVRLYPDQLAVKYQDHLLTFRQLDRVANRIANSILKENGSGPEPIGLMFHHGVSVIASILGVLKAGKFYAPMDLRDPAARNTAMLDDSRAGLILTDHAASRSPHFPPTPRQRLLHIDDLDPCVSHERPGVPIAPSELSYIIYTSGSTGKPKAIMQNHRNVLQNTRVYAQGLRIGTRDRLTLLHSWSSSACILNLYGALLSGAALILYDVRGEGVARVTKRIADDAITVYHSVPSLFREIAQSITPSYDLSKLRVVHLSGEAATQKDLNLYRKHFSLECILAHSLGSSETQTVSMNLIDRFSQITTNRLPVDPAVEGKEVILAGHFDTPADDDAQEIFIRSRYLSPGYWHDPDRTRARFIPAGSHGEERIFKTGDLGRRRSDGGFDHLGRKDERVKIRGYRVELAEIEIALRNFDDINDAAVLARGDSSGELRLIAYVVPNEHFTASVGGLRRRLKDSLPDYMIPSSFVILENLPRTATGKVDKGALAAPRNEGPNLDTPYVAPRTPVEQELEKIFVEVLSLHRVGIHDSFFDRGGHSLTATRVVAQILSRFQFELTLRSMFATPTVASIAALIEEHIGQMFTHADLEPALAELDAMTDEEATALLEKESRGMPYRGHATAKPQC